MAQSGTTRTPEGVAHDKSAEAQSKAADAIRKAREDEQAALAKAAAAEQKDEVGSGTYVVLDTAFVARIDAKDRTATHRYGRGETFEPIEGLHNVDRLIKLKTIGKVDGKSPLRPSTALIKAQAAAEFHQEDSPVLDLTSVPFEQNVVTSEAE